MASDFFDWDDLERQVQAAMAPLLAREAELEPIYKKTTEEYSAAQEASKKAYAKERYWVSAKRGAQDPDGSKYHAANQAAIAAGMEEKRMERLWRSAYADYLDIQNGLSNLRHLTAAQFAMAGKDDGDADRAAKLATPCPRRNGAGNHVFSIGSTSGGGAPSAVIVHCIWCQARVEINEQQAAIVLLKWAVNEGRLRVFPVLLPLPEGAAT